MGMEYPGNNRISGVVPAVVIDNQDPEGRYRVKVMFPQWSCDDSRYASGPVNDSGFISGWARVATFMSGPERGAFFLPEVDDEVLVCFEQGDVRFPYVVGSLWNGVDKAINVAKDQEGDKNNFRSIRSRSGHVLTFVDDKQGNEEKIILQTVTKDGEMAEKDPANRDGHFIVLDQGKEKIEIRDTTKKLTIVLDSSSGEILIETESGDMKLKASETLSIECKKLEIKADTDIEVESGTSTKMKAGSGMEIDGGPKIKQKAALIELN